ncbi:NAD(P)-dependent dehydrogenase (short-subunit alcohol dehydrogenase family) [Bradyrhizobium sp. LM2.9]
MLLDVNADTVAEAAEGIRKAGGKAESFALDVTKRDDCFALAKQVADKVGQVSILVNNAGITRRNAFTAEPETVAKDWNDIISLNLNGVFNMTQAFLSPLRAAKGRIVNIGSIQSFVHLRTPSSAAYTTSKHGVLGFTKALAAELGKEGVRVTMRSGRASSRPTSTPMCARRIRRWCRPSSITPRWRAPASPRTS